MIEKSEMNGIPIWLYPSNWMDLGDEEEGCKLIDEHVENSHGLIQLITSSIDPNIVNLQIGEIEDNELNIVYIHIYPDIYEENTISFYLKGKNKKDVRKKMNKIYNSF